MKVHSEDWKGSMEMEGYAMTCANDGPDLCDSVVSQFEEGVVPGSLREW